MRRSTEYRRAIASAIRSLLPAVLLLLTWAQVSTAQRTLGRDREFALALSALPAALRDSAGVFLLGPAGFEPARPSANGFHCLVERDDPHTLAPICFDAEGSATTLRTVLFRGRLRQAGKSEAEITRAVAAEYRSGGL